MSHEFSCLRPSNPISSTVAPGEHCATGGNLSYTCDSSMRVRLPLLIEPSSCGILEPILHSSTAPTIGPAELRPRRPRSTPKCALRALFVELRYWSGIGCSDTRIFPEDRHARFCHFIKHKKIDPTAKTIGTLCVGSTEAPEGVFTAPLVASFTLRPRSRSRHGAAAIGLPPGDWPGRDARSRLHRYPAM